MRRRRDAGGGARGALEQAREGLGRALARRGLEHRARRACAPCGAGRSRPRCGTRARRRACSQAAASTVRRKTAVLGLGGREGAEVVLAEQRLRAGREQLVRELARPVPGARGAQRRGRARAQHAVLVAAGARREARVEALRARASQASTATSGGRCALSAAATRAGSGPARCRRAHDLARGVHARIGAPGHGGAAAVAARTRAAPRMSTLSTVRRPGCAAQP